MCIVLFWNLFPCISSCILISFDILAYILVCFNIIAYILVSLHIIPYVLVSFDMFAYMLVCFVMFLIPQLHPNRHTVPVNRRVHWRTATRGRTRVGRLWGTHVHTYSSLQYNATHWLWGTRVHTYSSLQYNAIHCDMLQHTATHCDALQHATLMQCPPKAHTRGRMLSALCMLSALWHLTSFTQLVWKHLMCCCSVLQCVAVCCSVLQCVAVCCRVLPCVAVCCSVL